MSTATINVEKDDDGTNLNGMVGDSTEVKAQQVTTFSNQYVTDIDDKNDEKDTEFNDDLSVVTRTDQTLEQVSVRTVCIRIYINNRLQAVTGSCEKSGDRT